MSTPPIPPDPAPTPPPLEYATPIPPTQAGPDKVFQMAKASWVAIVVAWLLAWVTNRNMQGSFAVSMIMLVVQLGLIIAGLVFGCVAIAKRRQSSNPSGVVTHGTVGIVLSGLTIALNIFALIVLLRLR